jgi:endonuclease/exonuclease/phosphatase family metal-dependent hydrolase
MRLWQANLGRNVSTPEYLENLDRVLVAAGRGGVVCLQEIDEADRPEEMDWLRKRVRKTHRIVGQGTAVPILVPRSTDILAAHIEPACKGLARFTPNRVVNKAVLEDAGLEVAVLNTHLPINRVQTATRRREVRQVLREQARQHGAGVWVADTNTRVGWPTIVKGEVSVTNAGIDKAKAWAPKSYRVKVFARRTVNLTIDNHDAHGALLYWTRGA